MLYVPRGPHNPPFGWVFFAVVLGVYVRRVGPACSVIFTTHTGGPGHHGYFWLLLRGGVSSRQWPAVVTDSPYDIATGQDRVQAAYLGGRVTSFHRVAESTSTRARLTFNGQRGVGRGYLLRLVLLWWGQH